MMWRTLCITWKPLNIFAAAGGLQWMFCDAAAPVVSVSAGGCMQLTEEWDGY